MTLSKSHAERCEASSQELPLDSSQAQNDEKKLSMVTCSRIYLFVLKQDRLLL